MRDDFLTQVFDLYSQESDQAFGQVSYCSSLFRKMILDRLPLVPSLKVLDVACGTGFPLFEIAERLGPSSQLTGIDLWSNAWRMQRILPSKQAILAIPLW